MLSLWFPRELDKLKAGRRQNVNATNESYIPFGADSKNYTLLAVCRDCKWAFKEWKKNSRKKTPTNLHSSSSYLWIQIRKEDT